MKNFTPIMQQYIKIKKENKDKILFFRLGDFYEMFFNDAIKCAEILMLQLTSRGIYKGKKIPMCGFPHYMLNNYLIKLLKHGKKVSICEQFKNNNEKTKIINRKVTKIYSPGTFVSEKYLKNNKNNYISCIYKKKNKYGFSSLDLSTGYFFITNNYKYKDLLEELDKSKPIEILTNKKCKKKISFLKKEIHISKINYKKFLNIKIYKKIRKLLNINLTVKKNYKNFKLSIISSIILLNYLLKTQEYNIKNISKINIHNKFTTFLIDKNTRKNLEIFKSTSGNEKNSLFNTIDKTSTSMGKRLLRRWIINPLLSKDKKLKNRINSVSFLKKNLLLLNNLKKNFKKISDLEILIYKLNKTSIKPYELKKIETSLINIKIIKKNLKNVKDPLLKKIHNKIKNFKKVIKIIKKSINIKAGNKIKNANIIKKKFDIKIDKYREKIQNVDKIINKYQIKQKQKINYNYLKIMFNKNGYFIDLPLKKTPTKEYKKIKDLKTSIRYTTFFLKNLETKIFKLNENLIKRELKIYRQVCKVVKKFKKKIQITIKYISILDIIKSFAEISVLNSWCKPIIKKNRIINIKNGRHPIIEEKKLHNFISNNTLLNNKTKTYIITGPNMGGKSTYMRQIAIIVLLAHIGSHVPASSATIGGINKIFTRIGSNDDISNSLSTFMLEINELSYILKKVTFNSLVLIDEIGRGTNYLEGMSLALGIMSTLITKKKPFLLFSTHFFDIAYIGSLYLYVKCIYFKAIIKNKKIIFFYKYSKGIAKNSLAIKIAQKAGLPKNIIHYSEYYLKKIKNSIKNNIKNLILIKNMKKKYYLIKKILG